MLEQELHEAMDSPVTQRIDEQQRSIQHQDMVQKYNAIEAENKHLKQVNNFNNIAAAPSSPCSPSPSLILR